MEKTIRFLRVCSDLHLEFSAMREQSVRVLDRFTELVPKDERDTESLLILAGDISSYREHLVVALAEAKNRFASVMYVPGNHEFWGNDLVTWDSWVEEQSDLSVSIAKQNSILARVGGRCKILATTLWTSCGGDNPMMNYSVSRMPDFQRIKNNGRKLLIQDIQQLSERQYGGLKSMLGVFSGPNIVVTHHLPSFHLCDPRFSPSPEDGLFASNYDDLLSGPNAPKLWICGHTHTHIDRKVGDTWVVANPAGYPNEGGVNYDNRMFIDLEDIC